MERPRSAAWRSAHGKSQVHRRDSVLQSAKKVFSEKGYQRIGVVLLGQTLPQRSGCLPRDTRRVQTLGYPVLTQDSRPATGIPSSRSWATTCGGESAIRLASRRCHNSGADPRNG